MLSLTNQYFSMHINAKIKGKCISTESIEVLQAENENNWGRGREYKEAKKWIKCKNSIREREKKAEKEERGKRYLESSKDFHLWHF